MTYSSSDFQNNTPDYFPEDFLNDVGSASLHRLDIGPTASADNSQDHDFLFQFKKTEMLFARLRMQLWVNSIIKNPGYPNPTLSAFQGDLVFGLLLDPFTQSPFENIVPPQDYETKFQEIIFSFRHDLQTQIAELVADRLQQLADLADVDDVAPNLESLGRLFGFIAKNRNLEYPAISITPAGNMYAQWWKSAEKKFSLEFYPDGEVYFVLFQPDERSGVLINRLYGSENVETILEHLGAYHLERWICVG